MPSPSAPAARADIRRELHFLALYRLLEAALLCLVAVRPAGLLLDAPARPALALGTALAYLAAALVLFLLRKGGHVRTLVLAGVAVDILAAMLATHAMPALGSGIAMLLLFNVGAAALLLPLRLGLGSAALAGVALVGQYLWAGLGGDAPTRPLAELVMFTVSYAAIAALANFLGRQLRASEALAERRGTQAANLAEINELVIRRLRTGVLLVDADGRIRLANEAATVQLGHAADRDHLATAAPPLLLRMQAWQREGNEDPTPLALAPGLPEVLPRFTRLLAGEDQLLVFLDDASVAARRAESLTLATLGRFAASLAHEIRNPLAAISYASQLLEESQGIGEDDRRLLQIIYQQTQRMNGIVENVLGLARREAARPEHLDLGGFVRRFVADYADSHPLEHDRLDADAPSAPLPALFDHRQLQQVLTVLVHNALVHGRNPGQPARVAVHAHADADGQPLLDVQDHGPGIPPAVAAQLFRPFFTTSGHGTGLGLYIARELCLANQARLEHRPLAGGTCFRIRLPGPHAIRTA